MPEFPALDEARRYSDEKIALLRQRLTAVIEAETLAVVAVGSFGRREASPHSDLDFFLISNRGDRPGAREVEAVRELITDLGIKMPSTDGAFNSHIEVCADMARKIGGFDDTTQRLTRRILFLLEGDWLCNQAIFDHAFDLLILHYVRETISEHRLCRFLLNDLIRYYRTICVDFECKTYEDGKPWGDRNIKLQFSRKLLYFSGILVVAETFHHNWAAKRDILSKYLRLTPIERLQKICGSQSEKALGLYDEFLQQLASAEVRAMLQRTPEDRSQQSTEFRNLKEKGHLFTLELSRMLSVIYDAAHPIHNALKF